MSADISNTSSSNRSVLSFILGVIISTLLLLPVILYKGVSYILYLLKAIPTVIASNADYEKLSAGQLDLLRFAKGIFGATGLAAGITALVLGLLIIKNKELSQGKPLAWLGIMSSIVFLFLTVAVLFAFGLTP